MHFYIFHFHPQVYIHKKNKEKKNKHYYLFYHYLNKIVKILKKVNTYMYYQSNKYIN